MAARSSWKGFLKVSLVTIPVKAFNATASGSAEIHLNQLHATCHSRIQYKKTCPVHGEVKADEIVSGYEYSKGQYVVVDPAEIDKLRSEDDKSLTVDTFVKAGTVDPVYINGRSFYLVPDGPVGVKGFSVLRQAMVDENRQAIAQVVLHGREQTVLVRPMDNVLVMSVLNLEHQVTKPAAFEEEAPKAEVALEELKMAKTLIDAATAKKFDFSKYKDTYTEKLTKLIEAKVAGEEIVSPPVHEQAQIINLMDALRQSVEKVKGPAEEAAAKPPKKVAASRRAAGETRKRKSS
jgi:DNA end-binding protein Ku